jgi:V-type H+-transporting ATPase subunit C
VQTLKLEIEHEPPSEDQSSKAPKPSRIEFFPEYIVTLVAIVPQAKTEDWCQNYSKLKGMEAGMVVPDSSRLLYKTNTHKFYSVTLIKKYKDTFIQAAKAEDYIIRDVDWSSADPKSEAQAIIDAEAQSFEEFLDLASTTYSELFVALLHIKMLRLYVDSVRRYGPNCTLLSVVVWTNNNDDATEVKDKLYDEFAELGGKAVHYDDKGRIIKHEGEGGKEEEAEGYTPFSCYEITIV